MPSRTIRPTDNHPLLLLYPVFLLLHHNSRETLRVLDVDGLDITVELLLRAFLVVTSPGDADAQPVWDTLDTLLPDLLIQLGVEADVSRTLFHVSSQPP